MQTANPRVHAIDDDQAGYVNPTAMISGALAQRIVNIAGIARGHAVMGMGSIGSAVEKALLHAGAHLQPGPTAATGGKRKALRACRQTWADVALWAADDFRQAALDDALAAIRQSLRPGGRLVVWALPDAPRDAQALSRRIQRLIDAAGFTSIIGSAVATAWGDVAVATGVHVFGCRGIDRQPSARREIQP